MNENESKEGKAPKVLILDVDFRRSGLASIAKSDKAIEQLFGYPPLHIKSAKGFKKFMEALGKRVDREVEYGVDSVYELNPKFKDLDFIVFDTLSGLQSFIVPDIRGPKSSMTQADWGRLGIVMTEYLTDISNLPCNVICMSHTKYVTDSELGRRIETPALSGQTGEQLGKYFDNVIFTNLLTDKVGKRTYRFQIAPDERRDCRSLPTLTEHALKNGGLMEQDFVKFFELVRQDTSESTKTLILGRVGSGKSFSLQSLANVRI